MTWSKSQVLTGEGVRDAVCPEVISASRSTDIPAFHADWFMHRLRAGYVKWVNPFNRRPQYVSFESTRAIVFWSKNPKPLMPYLPEIDRRGIAYYFQFTLNDYEAQGLEPHVPPLQERVATFRALSDMLGKERVVWRFDPLILTEDLDSEDLLRQIVSVGEAVHEFTTRLVFSFVDVASYARVRSSLRKHDIRHTEFSPEDMRVLASRIAETCREWGITPMTCAERMDLSSEGVLRGKCVDDCLLLRVSGDDECLARLFGRSATRQLGLDGMSGSPGVAVKDPGQRPDCCCVPSKDIGQYNTCPHLCVYCYANSSPSLVKRCMQERRHDSECISGA